MGRKSKTKKIVREILEEKAKKGRGSALLEKLSKPPSKKDLKKQITHGAHKKVEHKSKRKEKQVSKPANSAQVSAAQVQKDKLHHRLGKHISKHRRSIFGGLLAAIMLTLLACIAYLLFSKAFRPDPVAKLLPGESTVAIVELNTNFDHSQITRSFELLKNYPQYSREQLIKMGETALNLNYEVDLRPWLGRSVSIALMNSENAAGSAMNEAYFAEYLSKDELAKFLAAHSTSEKRVFENEEVFNLDQKYYATVLGQYLIVSLEEQVINSLISFNHSDGPTLFDSEKYQRVHQNLPLNKVSSLYLDFNNIQDSFFNRFPLLGEKGLNVSTIAPFVKIFQAQGIALIADDNNLKIQSFTALSQSDVPSVSQNYEATLSALVKKDALLFWGAQDLGSQFKRLITILSGGQEEVVTVFNRVINNYVKKYFGETITFDEDIFPLLSGEFAFALEPEAKGKNAYKVIFTLENGKVDALKLQDIAQQFASVGAIFAPKVVEHTLADGTVTKEIVAVPEEITTNQSNYKDTTIYGLKAGNRGWSIYYAFVDNKAVIATSSESVRSSIDLLSQSSDSLHDFTQFTSTTGPILASTSEVSYFNIQSLLPLLFGKNNPPEILKIFDTIASGKSYSNDGITTNSYLNLK